MLVGLLIVLIAVLSILCITIKIIEKGEFD